MEGKDISKEAPKPQPIQVSQPQPPQPAPMFQSPAADHSKNSEKYRALKRKFKVLRDVFFAFKSPRTSKKEYINLLGMYDAACNKVKILSNEKLFLQTKVDAVLKAQKVEEEEKKQPAPHLPPPAPVVSTTTGHQGKHSKAHPAEQLPALNLPGKRDMDSSKHHVSLPS